MIWSVLTTLGIVLAVMWSAGCVGLILRLAWFMWLEEEERGMALALLLLGFPIACVLAVLPWAFMQQEASPDLATLKKNEWSCQVTSHQGQHNKHNRKN